MMSPSLDKFLLEFGEINDDEACALFVPVESLTVLDQQFEFVEEDLGQPAFAHKQLIKTNYNRILCVSSYLQIY